jgi:protein PhnA
MGSLEPGPFIWPGEISVSPGLFCLGIFSIMARTDWGLRGLGLARIGGAAQGMTMADDQTTNADDYVYDEASGEWISAADARAQASGDPVEVRDAVGNLLADGDQVTLIKDLTVKGAGQTLKRGTLIKSIRLTGDAQEIDCRFDGIKGLVLRAEFVKKR